MSQSNGSRLRVSGVVQGVGFRPFVWQLANDMALTGQVFNDAAGVTIDILANAATTERFVERLCNEHPPLAVIESVTTEPASFTEFSGFHIVASQAGEVSTGCAPDSATCTDCLSELHNSNDRRYGYPFINCTNCGPRLSIIKHIPYDRASTTMADFTLCEACQREYDNPADRRFHAQPNACPDCGPQCVLESSDGTVIQASDPFAVLATAIKDGKIVAVKGIGGVHLVCDATNEQAVQQLRERKYRPGKALALMAHSTEAIKQYAIVSEHAEAMLSSPAAPVVLMPKRNSDPSFHAIARSVAPDTGMLGFMLPYSPIHWLLMAQLDVPVVMTSGNRSGSPQAISNDDAREQLQDIADLLLLHNRPIHNRLDDSVVLADSRGVQFFRRARGFAPTSLPLPPGFRADEPLIALGGQLKNTVCMVKSNKAIVTQHLGDLHDASTYDQYLHIQTLFTSLYDIHSQRYACDMHPEYLSTKNAEGLAEQGKTLFKVQHHHAHMAACMGDNQYPLTAPKVLGICLDGTGYGTDGSLWGGEFLFGGYHSMERVGSITPVPLIGGAQAITSPWRTLYAQLRQHYSATDIAAFANLIPQLGSPVCQTFDMMLEKGLNVPMTSSAGRLFDAVAAALGCSADNISYEGQAAIQLETLAGQCSTTPAPYEFTIEDNLINTRLLWQALLDDLSGGRDKASIAAAFHSGFIDALLAMTAHVRQTYEFDTVALSGGVMQNQRVFHGLTTGLESQGLTVLTHKTLPANDGGIAFGQALVALAQVSSV